MIETSTVSSTGRAIRILAASLAIAAAAGAARSAPASQAPLMQLPDDPRPWNEKVAPNVMAAAVTSAGNLDVIVKLREPEGVRALSGAALAASVRLRWIADTDDGLDRDWSPGGVQVLDRFSHLAVVHASVPAQALAAFAEDQRVDAIVLNRKVHALDATGNAYMHVSAIQPPNTGAGVGIAILDTGVDYTHPELAPLGTKTIALYDAYHSSGDPAYAKDDNGHGTEVAGTAAAFGLAASAAGVAPQATVISVKVLDSSGQGQESTISGGINAVLSSVAGGNPYNIRAANLSLGGYEDTGTGSGAVPTQPCDSEDPVMASLFQQLTTANVMPVVASGNGGCTNGVAWPACISASLAVGAVYAQSFPGLRFSDQLQCNATGETGCTDTSVVPGSVACFTDSGPKLDVWAPTCAVSVPRLGGGYSSNYFCGTSASAPYAAGLVALLAQASPGTGAAAAKTVIRATGTSVTDARNGIARNAIQADQALAGLSCTPPSAPSSIGVNKTSVCSGEQAVVSWTSVAGATSYTVQVDTDSGFPNPTSATATSASYSFSSTQASAGTFYFRVEAVASCGTSSWSGTASVAYTPQCQSSYGYTYFLSGIARIPGVAPAFWYSDVSVLNATTSPASLRITFYGLSSFPAPFTDTLGGSQQLTFADVLSSLFSVNQDKGMIVVESTVPIQAVSRTYSRVTSGPTVNTFGQSYVGLPASQALTTAATGWFPALRSDGAFRTNLEFVNTSAVQTDVLVSFYTAGGAPIGSTTVTVPALRWTQVVRALPAGQAAAFAKVQVVSGGAQILGSASVIDGNSTDPTTIPMWVQ
ncbi:MAG TPA: S8 family serine peptidase [Thermoanaerobaculaceae bacterium]|nr:S8 family serine peptidase [Thermoanaerobaculaceae bacterium]